MQCCIWEDINIKTLFSFGHRTLVLVDLVLLILLVIVVVVVLLLILLLVLVVLVLLLLLLLLVVVILLVVGEVVVQIGAKVLSKLRTTPPAPPAPFPLLQPSNPHLILFFLSSFFDAESSPAPTPVIVSWSVHQ